MSLFFLASKTYKTVDYAESYAQAEEHGCAHKRFIHHILPRRRDTNNLRCAGVATDCVRVNSCIDNSLTSFSHCLTHVTVFARTTCFNGSKVLEGIGTAGIIAKLYGLIG